MGDHYKTLNVRRDATTKEINAAYIKRMRYVHPDVSGGDGDAAKRLNLARDVLCDPVRRAEYDRELQNVEADARVRAEAAAQARADAAAQARADAAARARAEAQAEGAAHVEAKRRARRRRLAWGISVPITVGVVAVAMFVVFGVWASPSESSKPIAAAGPTSSSTLPPRTSHIDLTQVADYPGLAGIAKTLDTYFTGINTHNGDMMTSAFAPGALSNPNELIAGTKTTSDDRIAVHRISPARFGGRPGYNVRITFRSHQAASQGDGRTCTQWAVTEPLVLTPTGPRMLGARHASASACAA